MPLISLLTMALATAAPGPDLPVPVAARAPTLPQGDVRIDADSTVGLAGTAPATVDFAAGFGVGVSDRFEVGAQVLPLDLAPEVIYDSPSLYASYGAPLGDFASVTPTLRAFLPLTTGSDPMVDAIASFAFHSSPQVALTVEPMANVAFGDTTESAFAVPVGLVLQPDRRVFLTVDSGLSTDPMDPRFLAPRPGVVDDAAFLPLGAAVGTTFGRPRKGVSDLSLGFYFPELAEFSAAQTTTHTDDFTVLARFQTLIPTGPEPRGKRHVAHRD